MSKQHKSTTIAALHSDRSVFAVAADNWNAEIIKGESIRIFGVDGNRFLPQSIDRTYEIGDRAAYDSFNLIYTGKIISITEKTVTIEADGGGKRLRLANFFSMNRQSIEEIDAHNAEESKHI